MTSPPAAHVARTPNRQDKLTGIACGIGAGALWGLVFLAPELASAFNPLQLTVGRYFCYGLIATLLLAPRWRSLRRVSRRQWLNLAWLAFTGNTLYYILLASAVQNGGIAMTSLIIGFLPVVITVIGSRDRGAVSLARLLPSLLLGTVGIVCIGWQALSGSTTGSVGESPLGLLCAFGALVSWTAFAIGNARCLTALGHISIRDWGLLLGIATGMQSVVLIPLALMAGPVTHDLDDWIRLGAVSVGLAIAASIIGTALWNRMSRLLPLTLVGQMILFETLFALLYGFLWEARLPTLLEMVALIAVVLSVLSCLAAHKESRSK
jgi:drug/metabolite transporter (DMT)-like permease